MYKKILSFILCICLITNISLTVYASEESISTWEEAWKNFQDFSSLDKLRRLNTFFMLQTGMLPNKTILNDMHDYWLNYLFPDKEKTLADMTEDELDALLETYYGKLNSKGCKCDSNGNVTLSDDFIKEFRSWLDTYMKDNTTPLYYMVHVSNFSDLKASNCGKTYYYNTIKNAVEKYGVVGVQIDYGKLYITDLSSLNQNYLPLLYSIYNSGTEYQGFLVKHISKDSEALTKDNYIAIDFGDDYSEFTDFENDYRIVTNSTNYIYPFLNPIEHYSRNGTMTSWSIGNNYCVLSKNDMYIKVFTSIANYQDYISNTAEQKIYYTSNYFKTENIQQSPIGLDEMVKLYEAYDDLCKKIIQYVQDTQNATDTMIVNKLDELIKAVYSSSGSGSTDVDVSVDMSETNTILDKILKKLDDILQAIKTIGNIEIIDIGEDNPITEWTNNITNMVVNPEANIDATIGDISGSMNEPISLLKTKFPFSIPWDIAFLLEFLADSPETPKFEIPMKFESMNIDEKLTIDFSHFESVSKVSRMLLTLLFMVALMNLTTKVFNIGGTSND